MKSKFVGIHVIQSVPPSCVNRDDIGSPKSATYGGVKRARVSSQSWKHAMRKYYNEHIDANRLGIRTRNVVDLVNEEILSLGSNVENEHVEKALGLIKIHDKTVPIFLSKEQIHKIAEIIIENIDIITEMKSDDNSGKEKSKKKTTTTTPEQKELKKRLESASKEGISVDMALFGRMIADTPLNVEAAAQVAHSISTHEVNTEYDYFIASDENLLEGESGAAYLDVAEYNSSTLYRYANVNVTELEEHLGKDTVPEMIAEFIKSFIFAMPSGKQNSYANKTLPSTVFITIEDQQPVNLVGAFEKPVKTKGNGYIEASEQAFKEYVDSLYSIYQKPEASFIATMNPSIREIAQESYTISDMIDAVKQRISEQYE